jgi:YfiH family protein
MSVGVLQSGLLCGIGVPHAFTTRVGGVSGGIFTSLNFGNPADLPPWERDPETNITENYRRVLRAIGAEGREVVRLHQVHGAGVHVFRTGDGSRGQTGADDRDFPGDVLVSDDPSRLLTVRVADCAPVLLASADGRVVACVHAGWRGVLAGAVMAGVERLRAMGAGMILGAIGPCIGHEAFEVGPEVVAAFREVFGGHAPVFDAPGGRGRVDLKEALRLQMLAAGVARIDVLQHCTVSDPAMFFSHRRERGRTGRMIGAIGAR